VVAGMAMTGPAASAAGEVTEIEGAITQNRE
jgi:hypothetical protein